MPTDDRPVRHPAASGEPHRQPPGARFTARQGQVLAFIHLYRKLHRRGPAEADVGRFFGLTPPAAHAMVVRLADLGLVARDPGVARSVRVLVPAGLLPLLDDVPGPAW